MLPKKLNCRTVKCFTVLQTCSREAKVLLWRDVEAPSLVGDVEVLEDKLVCFGAEGLNGECVAVSLGVALPDEVGPVDVALLLEEALGSPPTNLAEIPAKLKKEMLLRYISMGKCRFSTGNTEERLFRSIYYSSTKYELQYVPRQSSIIKRIHTHG